MKKNIIKYVAYLVTALPLGGVGGGLVSCSDDFLDDMTVYGSFSEDKVYSSYAGALDRVNTLYRELLPQACQGSGNGSTGQNTYFGTVTSVSLEGKYDYGYGYESAGKGTGGKKEKAFLNATKSDRGASGSESAKTE